MKKTLLTIATITIAACVAMAQPAPVKVTPPPAEKKMAPVAPVSPPTPATPAAAQTPAQPVNPNAGDFKFDETEFQFGSIKQGESVTHLFNFVNTGKEPIIISSAQGSCGCTVADYPKEPIAKGEKKSIKVTFNSAGKMGQQVKTVTINSNAKTNPIVIYMKGNVEAPPAAPQGDLKQSPTPTPVPADKK